MQQFGGDDFGDGDDDDAGWIGQIRTDHSRNNNFKMNSIPISQKYFDCNLLSMIILGIYLSPPWPHAFSTSESHQ